MIQRIKWTFFAVVVAAAVSFFIHPFGTVKAANSPQPPFSGGQADTSVLQIMQRSCQSCHSEQTTWPWYSYVPPVSWLVEKDVHDGRSRFNMSHWNEYSTDDRIAILAEISAMVKRKEMPLPRYVWLHSEAKLSDADINMLDRWSRAERKRLRETAASPEKQ